jgi:hypothetical protein
MLALTMICALLLLVLSACGAGGDPGTKLPPAKAAPILLFSGTGTSPNDVAALENIMRSERLEYSTIGSAQLSGMREEQMREYRLLIVPGGNFETIGRRLSSGATANLRNAIQHGLNYLGICAGAFFAGNSPYNGLNLTSGVRFDFYAAEFAGIRKAAVPIATSEGTPLDQYWEDGPHLAGWGAVVAKYPDGTPAVVQGNYGNGWVVLITDSEFSRQCGQMLVRCPERGVGDDGGSEQVRANPSNTSAVQLV